MLGCGPSRERASEQPSKPGRRCASFYVIIVLIITIATCKYYFLLCVPCHQPFLASLSVFSFFFFFPCNPLNRGLVIAFLSRETELFEERILPRNCALSRGLSRKEFSPISPVKLVPVHRRCACTFVQILTRERQFLRPPKPISLRIFSF